MNRINVACAIIVEDEKVLVAQRSERMSLPLKWEFPGGKINDGETKEQCIHRELREELNINIQIENQLQDFQYDYHNFRLTLTPFVVSIINGVIRLLEHKQVKWINKKDLEKLDWAAADVLIVKELMKEFK